MDFMNTKFEDLRKVLDNVQKVSADLVEKNMIVDEKFVKLQKEVSEMKNCQDLLEKSVLEDVLEISQVEYSNDELLPALEALKLLSDDNEADELLNGLKSLIAKLKIGERTKADETKKAQAEELVKNGIVDSVIKLLSKTSSLTAPVIAKISEMLAELTKVDLARKSCTDLLIITPLVELLDNENEEVVIQTCRALGNICYENDLARGHIKDLKGVTKLVQLLEKLLSYAQMPDNLRTVASGCLFNMTDTYEETQDQAIQAGIVDVLLQYLHRFYNNEEVATHCLLVLNCLADLDSGRTRLMEKPILTSLLNLFEHQFDDESLESLLELIGNIAEDDSVKIYLCKNGFTERLLKLIHQHQQRSRDEDCSNMLKIMYELIILILTGDESMEYLYADAKGAVYKETLAWLASPEENVQVAGALAIGNFARNDTHCIQIVQDNVTVELLKVLQKHSGIAGDIRLQHAILSALRNLAIPGQNKSLLIQTGVLEQILPMINIETFPVVFKLLGTFRMLIDKQQATAEKLGQNSALIKRLVTWSQTEDHPGVKGEATRLLAWIVKNAPMSVESTQLIINEGGVPHLVSMMFSEHLLMQNEAMVAINVIAVTDLSFFESASVTDKLMGILKKRLERNNLNEILDNAITLVKSLSKSNSLKSKMASLGILEDIKKLESMQDEEVHKMVASARQVLDI